MDVSDLLLVGAEVSVAFAGFAGIIATFQFRDETKINRGQIVGLSMIVHMSLMLAFASALPLLLSVFRVEDATIWAICSGFGVIWSSYTQYSIHKNMRGAVRRKFTRLFFNILQGIFALLAVALILNLLDLVFHREPGPYIAAIVMGLGLVGYMFTRLLVRPLWKVVHEQEAADPKVVGPD